MAGTNRPLQERSYDASAPAIILVEPQLGENIGSVARAMLNFGLTDMRLVRPRDGWPNARAIANAAGADLVLDAATLHETVGAAVDDLHFVYASTARPRDMIKDVATPDTAARNLRAAAAAGQQTGVLLGRESTGLDNDAIALADAVISVPSNPGFSSLNLGMAALLIGYEWFKAVDETPSETLKTDRSRPATKAELHGLFKHLEAELDACGFLRVTEKRPSMVRNLRNLFQRARLTEQEVRTLHGVVTGLVEFARPNTDGS